MPELHVQLVTFENLRWFAGRGYDVVSVSIPARYAGPGGSVDADFLLIMWENNADPVTTGREELGFPKLFADIDITDATEARRLNSLHAQASWGGTTFFRAELHDFEPADLELSGLPLMTHRYVPSVGNLDAADADYLTVTAPGPAPAVTYSATTSGGFVFEPVTWNDIPLQYPAINALAGLDITSIGSARFVCVEGGSTAAPNRRLD